METVKTLRAVTFSVAFAAALAMSQAAPAQPSTQTAKASGTEIYEHVSKPALISVLGIELREEVYTPEPGVDFYIFGAALANNGKSRCLAGVFSKENRPPVNALAVYALSETFSPDMVMFQELKRALGPAGQPPLETFMATIEPLIRDACNGVKPDPTWPRNTSSK